jgi:hypothetical protein
MLRDDDVFAIRRAAGRLATPAHRRPAVPGLRETAPAALGLALRQAAPGDAVPELPQETRRRRIWELDATLHCSIVGTCLSAGELRQLLARLDTAVGEPASDHDLHGRGVIAARQRQGGGKQLNKALDRRHHVAINQFAKARSDTAVGALWADAVKRGDIPGAYWAVLTHPATSEALRRKVFGEVHMLSHLVGAANRADIRRLHQLEQENAALQAKVERQQGQLRDAVVSREAKLRELEAALSERIAADADSRPQSEIPAAALDALVAGLERRLAAEAARRERLECRLEQSVAARAAEDERSRQALCERDALRVELAAAEQNLAALFADEGEGQPLDLAGLSLLYVGGRPHQVSRLRSLAERASARFLHHDGGIDERSGVLPGLISQADIAFFPVDCVSHEAALMVKRLCRQSGKPWIPLRSASITAFLAAVTAALGAARAAE